MSASTSGKVIELYEDTQNPLDAVEELFHSYEWIFNRSGTEELTVEVTGQYGAYDIDMIWDEQSSCLQFIIRYDFCIPKENLTQAAESLMQMNERLWMGHFIVTPETHYPALRYASLFRGASYACVLEQLEDMLDTAVRQVEQYYPAFEWLSHPSVADAAQSPLQDNSPLNLALMQTLGES